MQLPIKAHYATIAVLALHRDTIPANLCKLVSSQPITQSQVNFSADTSAVTQRWADCKCPRISGGFRLAKSPDSISVADVVEAVCSSTSTEKQFAQQRSITRVVGGVWQELNETQLRYLEQLKLSSLVQQMSPEPAAMFFI